jgi:hypothetical protein
MEIAKDLMTSLRSRVTPPGPAGTAGAPAWSELHARFSAAHAAAGELARNLTGVPVGGFGLWQSGESNSSRPVNPTDLADGKSGQCIEGAIAGNSMIGGRGQ